MMYMLDDWTGPANVYILVSDKNNYYVILIIIVQNFYNFCIYIVIMKITYIYKPFLLLIDIFNMSWCQMLSYFQNGSISSGYTIVILANAV